MSTEQEYRQGELFDALRRVADSVAYIRKDGYNQHQKFAFASEAQVKAEFRRQFLRAGLLFYIDEEACDIQPHTSKDGGNAGYLATVRLKFTIMHIATGCGLESHGSGSGYDSTDKAIGKAYSYAVKTWLLNSFLVQTGEDADIDENGERLDLQQVGERFAAILKDLEKVQPKKGAAKEKWFWALSHSKTTSGHPVEDPSQFTSKVDALGAYRTLQILLEQWKADRFDMEAQSGKVSPAGGASATGDGPEVAGSANTTSGPQSSASATSGGERQAYAEGESGGNTGTPPDAPGVDFDKLTKDQRNEIRPYLISQAGHHEGDQRTFLAGWDAGLGTLLEHAREYNEANAPKKKGGRR